MITPAQRAEIRRLFYGEHWKVGTIAAQLGLHHETVRAAVERETGGVCPSLCRPSILDPYLPFIRDTLAQYPQLRATRIYEMVRQRGYAGSVIQVRRLVRRLRPETSRAVYRRVVTLAGESAQVDWGSFGKVRIGQGTRTVSGFVMVLGYSRALAALFPGGTPDQYELLAELKRRGELRIRVKFLFRARGARTAEELGALVEGWTAAQDEGDEWLRVGGVKLGVDGGFEGGWMREPYAEPFGRGGTFHGLQNMAADRFTMAVSELNRRGWRVATHAVGDAAIDQVLAGYEAANAGGSIGHRRWTIEHGFIVAADQLARIRELGLALSAQHHLYVAGPSLEQYWGRSRGRARHAAEDLPGPRHRRQSRQRFAGRTVPTAPGAVSLHHARHDYGGVFGPDERISREEALRVLTLSNA